MQEQIGMKSKLLVALVAGAAMALNVAPVAPAYAGLFGADNVKVERGAGSDFPSNEGAGNKVGSNTDLRGAASSGTPFGDQGAGGSLVGDNKATRQASSSGTPLGEGNMNTGFGVNVTDTLKVLDVPISNPLDNVGDHNPLKNGLPELGTLDNDAKSTLPNASFITSNTCNTPKAKSFSAEGVFYLDLHQPIPLS